MKRLDIDLIIKPQRLTVSSQAKGVTEVPGKR